jgi:predicted dehydrogenase
VVFEFERALAILTNSTSQPNAFAHRQFEVQGTNGTMLLKPIEPPTLAVDLAQAAGPYRAGKQTVELPKYERYRGDFEELARCISTETPLPASLDQELLVQEWLLRACGMFDA